MRSSTESQAIVATMRGLLTVAAATLALLVAPAAQSGGPSMIVGQPRTA
jgi:hypothetical protein